MNDEKIIMMDSDEAAKKMTVTGWVSRHGRFFGKDERTARYDGSTHKKCEGCGKILKKITYCHYCQAQKESEKFKAMPRRLPNREEPLYSIALDKYYFYDDWDEDLEDGRTVEDLMLVICDPVQYRQVDSEYWCDDLPEDGEIHPDLEEALKNLNDVISKLPPICWYPGKVAADFKNPTGDLA